MCEVKEKCPIGYKKEKLLEIANKCNINIEKQVKNKIKIKTMKELCEDISKVATIITKDPLQKNNETFGISIEYMICKKFNLDCKVLENRISSEYVNNIKLLTLIDKIFKSLPEVNKHIGYENGPIDFICKDNTSLSIKTNLLNNKKVCPQDIGQISKEKFIKLFIKGNIYTSEIIKKNILINPSYFIKKYLEKTFICTNLVWIYNDKGTYLAKIYNKGLIKNKFFSIKSKDYTFTKTFENWNESNTIKYKGITIGEFQIHNNRNVVKFRFNFLNLLNMLNSSKFVNTVNQLENFIEKKQVSDRNDKKHKIKQNLKSL